VFAQGRDEHGVAGGTAVRGEGEASASKSDPVEREHRRMTNRKKVAVVAERSG